MTTWIFLRGLTRESRHWGGFVDQFQQTIPGSTVIALGLPGNGLLNAASAQGWMAVRKPAENDMVICQQTIPGSTVIALDLPGNGLLNTGCSPWRVQDMVAQCWA